MITNAFRSRPPRDWLCQNADASSLGLKYVATSGSGPFQEGEFDDFLRRLQIEPRGIAAGTRVLVVGRRDWSENSLKNLIRQRSGQRLWVYSQEMLIAYLATGIDPLTASEDVVERFGRGHPALVYLSEIAGFDWPTTVISGGGGSELDANWLEKGFLKFVGYTVGRSGGTEEERREALAKAYRATRLPAFFPAEYRSEWGSRRSSVRLSKMANSIATFCKHAKRRPRTEIAVAEWEEDLDWLKVTYYDGRYSFEWPSTAVW